MAVSVTATPSKLKQLTLFPDIICSAYLVAVGSPRQAFYRIWVEANDDIFTVVKESGVQKGRVLDKRAWRFECREDAQELFDRRIKEKTNPERNSPRKYTTVYNVC
jgi:hypothetical protein